MGQSLGENRGGLESEFTDLTWIDLNGVKGMAISNIFSVTGESLGVVDVELNKTGDVDGKDLGDIREHLDCEGDG